MPASILNPPPATTYRQTLPPPPQPAPAHSPWRGIFFIFALCLAALAYFLYSRSQTAAKTVLPATRTAVVTRGTLNQTLRLSGMTIASNTARLVTPRLAGRRSRSSSSSDFNLTLRFLLAPGSKVKKGDLVAEFDRQFMELRLDDLAADVRAKELALETVRANLVVNRKAYDQRIRVAEGDVEKSRLDLRTIPVRSAIVAAQYQLNLEEAQARLKQLRVESHYFDISETAATRQQELELAEEQLDLRRSQRNADRMRITAPIDGVWVPERIRRGGEYKDIQAGDDLSAGTVIGNIHDTGSLLVEASLNQADIHELRAGQAATLHAEAFKDLSLPARLVRVGSLAQAGGARADYVRNIPVRLKVLGSDPRLMPNYTVAADVTLASFPDSTLVPRAAVFSSPGGDFVYVRSSQGWQKRPITVAASNHFQVAVAAGVTQGEVVAVERPKFEQ